MSLIRLKRSRSSSATASGVEVRTARATSAVASRSQAAAFSSPVLASARASLTSSACRNERCSRVPSGNATTRVSGLTAIPRATSAAALSSVASLRSDSRDTTAGLIAACRSPAVPRAIIRMRLITHCVRAQHAAASSHKAAWPHR